MSGQSPSPEEPTWQVVHSDGSVCFTALDQEHAQAVAHYFDSNAATGEPMSCSPHGVRCVGPHTDRFTLDQRKGR